MIISSIVAPHLPQIGRSWSRSFGMRFFVPQFRQRITI
jgi:hypothetical protein